MKKISKIIIPFLLFATLISIQHFVQASPSHFSPGSDWKSSANLWPSLMETWNWHGDSKVTSTFLTHDHIQKNSQPTAANLKKFLAEFTAGRQQLNSISGVTAWKIQKNELKPYGHCQRLHLEGSYLDIVGESQDFVEEHAYCDEKLRVLSVIAPHASGFWKSPDLKTTTRQFFATAGTGN